MSDPVIDVGDGLTCFKAGNATFRVDVVAWVAWYARYQVPEGEGPHHLADAVRDRLEQETGVKVNLAQADAFLHAVVREYHGHKKQQLAQR